MHIKTKQRIVGALVFIAAVAIFVPLFFGHELATDSTIKLSAKIPPPPAEPTYQVSASGVQFQFEGVDLPKKNEPTKVVAIANPVANPAPKPATDFDAPPEAWVVRLGVFSNQANADKLVGNLRTMGYDAYTRAAVTNSNLLVVFVGPEIKKDKAQTLQQQLVAKFKMQGVVEKYQV